MRFFKMEYGREDGFVVKASGAIAMEANSTTFSALEAHWRTEFDAYGVTAEEHVSA